MKKINKNNYQELKKLPEYRKANMLWRIIALCSLSLVFIGATITTTNIGLVGSRNYKLGDDALSSVSNGSDCIAIGDHSVDSNISAVGVIGIGSNSCRYLRGNYNIGLGFNACRGTTTPADNTAWNCIGIGWNSLINLKDASNQIVIGIDCATNLESSGESVYIGDKAGQYCGTAPCSNTAIGWGSQRYCTANFNTSVGDGCMHGIENESVGGFNTAYGYYALDGIGDGQFNVAVGPRSLDGQARTVPVDGDNNIAIGYYPLYTLSTGNSNVAIGQNAAYSLSVQNHCLALGADAMYYMRGEQNIAIGRGSMWGSSTPANNTGGYNIGVSELTLRNLTSGSYNVAMQYNALNALTEGIRNIAIGHSAGASNQTGSDCVYIGSHAGEFETGSNKLFIDGYNRSNETDGRLNSLIYGEFNQTRSNQNLYLGANVTVRENLTVAKKLTLPVDTTDISNPPTDSELDSAFGTPDVAGEGATYYINDNGDGDNFYQAVSDGTNWWILTATKAQ